MKLIIDIPETIYDWITQEWVDNPEYTSILDEIMKSILKGKPYDERPQSSLERPLYEGVLFVDDYGINKVIKLDEDGTITAQMVIPRDTFIEAYNKFIKGE